MQKFFVAALAALCLLAARSVARADNYQAYETAQSSFSDVGTVGPVLVSTIPLRLWAVTMSSPANQSDGAIVFYRSTGTTFTADIATQTKVPCNWQAVNTSPAPVDMYGVVNTSSTWIQRIGGCMATIWYSYPAPEWINEGNTKQFGLPITGKRDTGQLPNN